MYLLLFSFCAFASHTFVHTKCTFSTQPSAFQSFDLNGKGTQTVLTSVSHPHSLSLRRVLEDAQSHCSRALRLCSLVDFLCVQ